MIKIGEKLPKLTAASTKGALSNKDFKGSFSVIYFYPKDNTPGCTTEGQDFRDLYNEFEKLNANIFGVSRDSIASHHKFIEKYSFPFPLISDENESLCNVFDVIKDKNMYGKKVRGIERSTFLFDKNGKLIKEWRKVKVANHVAEVLEHIKKYCS